MRKWQWAFAVAAAVWALSLPAAAFEASRPAAGPLGYGFAFVIYTIGHLVCHQRPERSFHLWAAQLPVCARCVGLYVGATLSAAAIVLTSDVGPGRYWAAWNVGRIPGRSKPAPAALLLFAAIPTALTLVYEWTTGRAPTNIVRASTALTLGSVVAVLLLSRLKQAE